MMIKKVIFLSVFFLLFSCGKKITEYKAYQYPERMSVRAGQPSFIAIKIDIPGSHYIYGNPKGPGTGKPTVITVKGMKNFIFDEARFLPAKKYQPPSEKEYTWTYSGETIIFIPFKTGNNAGPGAHDIMVTLDTLLCSDTSCMPKIFEIKSLIEIAGPGSEVRGYSQDIIGLYMKSRSPGEFGKNESNIKKEGMTDGKIIKPYKSDINFDNQTFNPQFIETSRVGGIIEAVIFAIIAGFILNFMPCVLPVVGLKVMSLVKNAGKERGEISRLGILFSLGILTSFLILASLAAFFEYNWGDLFQYRAFLIILTSLIFALALSMFDVYIINIPSFAGKAAKNFENPYIDSYFKGLLATLMATPCSGPFLGGTLAWTLNQPPLIIFIVFASIGAGMALPYLLLSIKPEFIKFIPKPGEWTRTFEKIMGFLLILTVLYLLNIMSAKNIMPMLTFLTFIAMGFWQYGKFGSLDKPRKNRIISGALLIAIIGGGSIFSFNYLYDNKSALLIESAEFSLKRLDANKTGGRISMVKFTADWCPNCKAVEKISLNTAGVAREIKSNNIDFMTADMTLNNPPARELLIKLQSRSIPFLAVFPHGESFETPVCLRDIYTEGDVINAVRLAIKKNSGK